MRADTARLAALIEVFALARSLDVRRSVGEVIALARSLRPSVSLISLPITPLMCPFHLAPSSFLLGG